MIQLTSIIKKGYLTVYNEYVRYTYDYVENINSSQLRQYLKPEYKIEGFKQISIYIHQKCVQDFKFTL